MWFYLDSIINTEKTDKTIKTNKGVKYTQQFAILLGQSLNAVTYHRRYNALLVLITQAKAKKTLKD